MKIYKIIERFAKKHFYEYEYVIEFGWLILGLVVMVFIAALILLFGT